MMLLYHAQAHSFSAGMILSAKYGSSPSSKRGGTSKIAKKRNVSERFSWIRGRLSSFFVFSQWKAVGSGGHFWWRLHPFCLLCKTETFKRILMRLFKIYRPPFLQHDIVKRIDININCNYQQDQFSHHQENHLRFFLHCHHNKTPDDVRSISPNVASLNILIHNVINLLFDEH